jgi:Tat protein secretion system quality control protein TatD with DNase activity
MRERLIADPTAIVGEIGLDKKWRAPPGWRSSDENVGEGAGEGGCCGSEDGQEGEGGDWGEEGGWVYETQLMAFKEQVRLATELKRPVSVHCVAAQGDMFDFFRLEPELPPAIYLHSFGGKVGMARNFIKMKKYGSRFYFGFSHFANSRSPKTGDVIACIPVTWPPPRCGVWVLGCTRHWS